MGLLDTLCQNRLTTALRQNKCLWHPLNCNQPKEMRNEMNETPNLSELIEHAKEVYGYDYIHAYAHVAGSMFALLSDEDKQIIAKSMGK